MCHIASIYLVDPYYVYTYPARKAVKAIMGKVKAWTRRTSTSLSLDVLLIQLNRMLRGWCTYCVSRGHARSDWRAVA